MTRILFLWLSFWSLGLALWFLIYELWGGLVVLVLAACGLLALGAIVDAAQRYPDGRR